LGLEPQIIYVINSILSIIIRKVDIMNFLDAVIKNNVEQVKLSLEQGVNPDIYEDKAHITALHFAAQNNALEVAEI
jgi:ankyrin repeat protein